MKRFLFLGMILLVCAPWSSPPAAASSGPSASEEIEEVVEVKVAQQIPGAWQVLGRMHPAVVHFPIGWLALTFLLDLLAWAFRKADLQKASFHALGATLLSFPPAAIAGYLRADELTGGRALPTLMAWHRNLNLLAAAICLAAFLLRLWKKNDLARTAKWGYMTLLTGALLVLMVGAHLGGKMVFGPDYLPF